MNYLDEFVIHIRNHDFPALRHLWEEYCSCDIIDAKEFKNILEAIKSSELNDPFGECVEWAIPLWQTISDKDLSYDIIRLIIDLETTNSTDLANIAFGILKERYNDHEYFNEKIRLIGLRQRVDFQRAISSYDLLSHMDADRFVYHTGGWGAGEIVELSLVREQLVIEFEHVVGRKDVSFENAFKNLISLDGSHFLAQRFGYPDKLEEEARKDPVKVVGMLLHDLGPKTAADLKDELCELVIPQKDWTKWWQTARAKIKKDTMIKTPKNVRGYFEMREAEQSHAMQLIATLKKEIHIDTTIATIYKFSRDFPDVLKNEEASSLVRKILLDMLSEEITLPQKLAIQILFSDIFSDETVQQQLSEEILSIQNVCDIINDVEVTSFKKRIIMMIRKNRDDWQEIFLENIFYLPQHTLKDYLLKELSNEEDLTALDNKIIFLQKNPVDFPKAFVWYFQKVVGKARVPFKDKHNQGIFLEGLLILLSYVEQIPEYRDMMKKIIAIITAKRFAIVRSIIEGTDVEFLHEFLLLTTKCRSLGDHNTKIMHSLAEVANPDLSKVYTPQEYGKKEEINIIWTTQEGFNKIKDRIEHIGTAETVENAREIEAARALGDLRENAEYKFALEKRSRLQGELTTLTEQLNRARIITKDDISQKQIGVGIIAEVEKSSGEKVSYTILGPWDASPENNVLSFQSKLAQAFDGGKVGDIIKFLDETYTIISLRNYFEE